MKNEENHQGELLPAIPQPGSREYEEAQKKMWEVASYTQWSGGIPRQYMITPYGGNRWITPYNFMELTDEQRRAHNLLVQPIHYYEEAFQLPYWIWGLPPGYRCYQYLDPTLNQRYLGGIGNLAMISYRGIDTVPEGSKIRVSIQGGSASKGKESSAVYECEIIPAQGEEAGPLGPPKAFGPGGVLAGANPQAPQNMALPAQKSTIRGTVQERETGLVLARDGDEIPLTNFSIAPVEIRIISGASGVEKILAFYVHNEGENILLTIPLEELERIATYTRKKVPACVVYDEVSGATSKVAGHVRGLLRYIPHVQIFKKQGWEQVKGKWMYVHDGAIPPSSNVRFQTGKTIACIPGMDAKEAVRAAMTLLNLSADPTKSYPICLYAHLGVMWRLFQEAGHAPHVLLFLNGTTGSLKTATALAAFDLFGGGISGGGNFRDTETALELKMGASRDSVMILDDFCPPVSGAQDQEQKRKLEAIIRFYGDGKGKSRGTTALELDREFLPEGLCAITGEDVNGTQSSLLRCLLISAEKGTFNSEMLKSLQDNPAWLSTHFAWFTSWVAQNFERLTQQVRTDFPRYRSVFSERLKERRLADTGAYLKLTGDIFLNYMLAYGVISHQELADLGSRVMDTLLRALKESEQSTQTADPVSMYLVALTDSLRRSKCLLASNRESYLAAPGSYVGYQEREQWWLCPNDVYLSIKKYWQQLGRIFPLKQDKIHVALAEAKVSETQVEHRENGDRRVCLIRTTLPDRPRFLVLHPERVYAIVYATGQGMDEGPRGLDAAIIFGEQRGREG